MASPSPKPAQPEPPPEFPRRIVIGRRQALGLAVLLALPLLALLGLLGDRNKTVEAQSGGLTLRAETISCARAGNRTELRLFITAPAASAGQPLEIAVSAGYLARFGEIESQPAIVRTTAGSSVLTQTVPSGGEAAPVLIEFTPARYGWARGWVRASLASGESVELPLRTFIFP